MRFVIFLVLSSSLILNVFLIFGFAMEYSHNVYFRDWFAESSLAILVLIIGIPSVIGIVSSLAKLVDKQNLPKPVVVQGTSFHTLPSEVSYEKSTDVKKKKTKIYES